VKTPVVMDLAAVAQVAWGGNAGRPTAIEGIGIESWVWDRREALIDGTPTDRAEQ
jgi:hypothetical protein